MSSLVKICLNFICKHFSVYTALTSTEDARLEKGLDFLRRVYSQNLLDGLGFVRLLDQNKVEFLLNKHLRRLDLVLLKETCGNKMIVDNVCKFSQNLRELLCAPESPSLSLEMDYLYLLKTVLPCSTHLTNICLPSICNDDILIIIASSCPNLIQLNICCSYDVTSVGLQELCRCPLLNLNLIKTCATVKDVGFLLTHIPTLQELNYKNVPEAISSIYESSMKNNLSDKGIVYNLTSLNFEIYNRTQNLHLLPLCAKICPHVRQLKLRVYEENDLTLCSHFPSISSLYLHGDNGLVSVEKFLRENGKKLKHIYVRNLEFALSTLIACCPNLESAAIALEPPTYLCSPNEKDLGVLNHLLTLELHLDSLEINENFVELLLDSCPMLETLILHHFDFLYSDVVTMLHKCLKNAGIKHLGISFCSEYGYDLLLNFNFSENLQCLTVEHMDRNSDSEMYSSFNHSQSLYNTVKAYNKDIVLKCRVFNKKKDLL